jgi:hypothetical protein
VDARHVAVEAVREVEREAVHVDEPGHSAAERGGGKGKAKGRLPWGVKTNRAMPSMERVTTPRNKIPKNNT